MTAVRVPSRPVDVVWPTAAVAAAVIGGVVITRYHPAVDAAALVGVALVTALQLMTLRHATGRIPAVGLIIAVLNGVGVIGYCFYPSIETTARVSTRLTYDPSAYAAAAQIFAAASLSLWIGALVAGRGAPLSRTSGESRSEVIVGFLRSIPTGKGLAAAVLPLLVGIYGWGPSSLIRRSFYLESSGPTTFVKIASGLVPIGVASAAFFAFGAPRRRDSVAGWILVWVYLAYAFATGSRLLALVPVLILGIRFLVRIESVEGRRPNIGTLIVALGLTLVFLHLPLALRSAPGDAGLAPYARDIFHRPSLLWPGNPLSSVGNVLFSVPLTGDIAVHRTALPSSFFTTAINPLPGSWTSWPHIQHLLELNQFTPYSSLGELSLYGWPFLVGYFLAVGFLAVRMQARFARLAVAGNLVGEIVLSAAFLLFSVELLQYNLRSATRLLWYSGVLLLVVEVAPSLLRSRSAGPTTAP